MRISDCAAWLRQRSGFLILSHHRPDGDALGSAAALCRGLRILGKTAYILENPQATDRYIPYVREYYAPVGYVPEHVITVDIAALSLLPENAQPYAGRIELAIDHHGSHSFFAPNVCLDAGAAAAGENDEQQGENEQQADRFSHSRPPR